MAAVFAVVAFAIALILHLVGHGAGEFILDFELAGFILVALHMAFGWGVPWHRTPPA